MADNIHFQGKDTHGNLVAFAQCLVHSHTEITTLLHGCYNLVTP